MAERDEIEHAMAMEIFRKEQHLDPTDEADFNREDFGFTNLDQYSKSYYESLANHLYAWLCSQGWKPPGQSRQ